MKVENCSWTFECFCCWKMRCNKFTNVRNKPTLPSGCADKFFSFYHRTSSAIKHTEKTLHFTVRLVPKGRDAELTLGLVLQQKRHHRLLHSEPSVCLSSPQFLPKSLTHTHTQPCTFAADHVMLWAESSRGVKHWLSLALDFIIELNSALPWTGHSHVQFNWSCVWTHKHLTHFLGKPRVSTFSVNLSSVLL